MPMSLTRSPHSRAVASTSDVSMATGPGWRSATSATVAYLWPCRPAALSGSADAFAASSVIGLGEGPVFLLMAQHVGTEQSVPQLTRHRLGDITGNVVGELPRFGDLLDRQRHHKASP
jgi:hypothetical protein